MHTSSRMGSSDSEHTALAVIPAGRPSNVVVTTVTPVAKCAIASRKASSSTVSLARDTWLLSRGSACNSRVPDETIACVESPTLSIRLLGEVDIRRGDVPVPALDSARAESLLAYLLIHRDAPQPRQRLAFLLWPDSTEAQARTNLRHVLHTLRRSLPDAERFLEITPRTLRWRPDAPLRLDVAAFEDALARARDDD